MKGVVSMLIAAGAAATFIGAAAAQTSSGPRAVLFDQPNFQGQSVTVVEGAPDLARWGFAAKAASARFDGEWTVCDAADLDGQCTTVKGDVPDLAQIGLRRIVSLGEAPADAAGDDREAAPGAAITSADAGRNADTPVARPATLSASATASTATATSSVAGKPGAGAARAAVARTRRAAASPRTTRRAAKAPAPMTKLAALPPTSAAQPTDSWQGAASSTAVFFAAPKRGGAKVAQGPADQFCRDQGLGPALYFDTDGHVLRDVLCRRS